MIAAARARPIIILGMSRSGTSVLGDLVHRWGAYGGDPEALRQGNSANPNGYFEYRPLQRFLLTQLGLDFWSARYAQRLQERLRDPECSQQARGLLAGMTNENPVWFWKEPALSVTLPFWKELWGDDVVYIVAVRDPYDTAVSWERFSVPPRVSSEISIVCAALLEWQHTMMCILDQLQEVPHKLFLSYEALVANPRESCRRLGEFLDRHRGGAGLDEPSLEHMVQGVEPRLHRNRGGVEFASRTDVTAPQKALFRFLLAKVDDPALRFVAEDYPLYEGWREYLANILFFRRFAAQVMPLLESRWVARGISLHRSVSRLMRAFRRPQPQA